MGQWSLSAVVRPEDSKQLVSFRKKMKARGIAVVESPKRADGAICVTVGAHRVHGLEKAAGELVFSTQDQKSLMTVCGNAVLNRLPPSAQVCPLRLVSCTRVWVKGRCQRPLVLAQARR